MLIVAAVAPIVAFDRSWKNAIFSDCKCVLSFNPRPWINHRALTVMANVRAFSPVLDCARRHSGLIVFYTEETWVAKRLRGATGIRALADRVMGVLVRIISAVTGDILLSRKVDKCESGN